ncbi:hypothetical protein LTR37_020626 [Vermiconidia calcicola]|uniref:Uncharacterized protein n=1 Tax=Vermiconidia calcicola TaxID=1690605 RepID=A0ACC3MC38_9PEZI|nr:hypothetical protein LTR37_020626 [Vermiconidia calcicola]
MGVAVSTGVATSPFFLASGIIGMISFAFTLGTFLKVVWVNLETLGEAQHEVHSYLTNLRTELLEERASLRNMKKGIRKHRKAMSKENGGSMMGMELDEITLKTMSDSVRHLIGRFRDLEKPFLGDGEMGIRDAPNHRKRARRRNSSLSPSRYYHAAYASPPEKSSPRARSNHERDPQMEEDVDEDAFWAQRTNYGDLTLHRRLIWLRKKAEAQNLVQYLSRVQIRRIARQVGGMTVLLHEYGCGTLELNETVRRIDERVSRVMGVRRVE